VKLINNNILQVLERRVHFVVGQYAGMEYIREHDVPVLPNRLPRIRRSIAIIGEDAEGIPHFSR
jgi:hypothetical protein